MVSVELFKKNLCSLCRTATAPVTMAEQQRPGEHWLQQKPLAVYLKLAPIQAFAFLKKKQNKTESESKGRKTFLAWPA